MMRLPRLPTFTVSVLLALIFGLLPMPAGWALFKPWWLALVMIYWTLESPQQAGLGRLFLIGLLADLLYGSLLGEQALRLCILGFLLLRFRARLRFFPMWQQALAVLALLLNDRMVVLMVRGLSGEGLPPWTFWVAPWIGMALWPWLFLVLDTARLHSRGKS
ncbi:MAG: Rod shape-determining protein MreD [Alphaproteobacteria bacterium ADurb.BinA280]|jgi:rod shape-determining protein MreD|nr:rod shape-determining protein MreD [Xanthomonadales bacterium]MCC6504002.1 rod shape-determining protein MreD [Aquimonas sp.]OPZ14010.1 MAG: Rod shape-determining protein MreD [Alphaproteobacteria bacterium ADurb.BinA280]